METLSGNRYPHGKWDWLSFVVANERTRLVRECPSKIAYLDVRFTGLADILRW